MSSIQKIEKYLDDNKHIGIFILRIFIGSRLFYGVIDNVLSWERMLEFSAFLEANAFPLPVISAVTSVYVQFFGAIMVLIGYKIRFACFILVVNFIVALFFVHLKANDTVEGMTPALAMMFGCLALVFTGADKISLDGYFDS